MDKQYFLELLDKYSNADLTKEEREFVENYYNLFQDEPDILDDLDADKKSQFKNEIRGKGWDRIINNESSGGTIRLRLKRNIWIAAAAIIVLILTIKIFFTYDPPPDKTTSENIAVKHQENRIIFLADGSKVILSDGSRLNYPSSFNGKEKREVYLEGQAFFDIQHNPKKPFIVHTGNLQTVVLGTAFNIKAMPGDKEITVSVVRGKVKVTDDNKVLGIITPNLEIKYNRKKDNSETQIIQDSHFLDWKSSDLLLDNVTVAEAARVLEEEYKMTIIISDPSVRSQRFTATFPRNGSLEQALKSICEFNGCNYNYDKNNATVTIVNTKIVTN